MTVDGHLTPIEESRAAEALVVFAAIAGCLALASRPMVTAPALVITVAVGVAGALAPTPIKADENAGRRAVMWVAACVLGIVAFASIRIASVVPPAPASLRVASMVVVAAVAEELFFRRFLYGTLVRYGAGVAIAGSAFAFALVHIPWYGVTSFPIDLAAGFVLSWQRWATGSWTASAASHAAANLMAIL